MEMVTNAQKSWEKEMTWAAISIVGIVGWIAFLFGFDEEDGAAKNSYNFVACVCLALLAIILYNSSRHENREEPARTNGQITDWA